MESVSDGLGSLVEHRSGDFIISNEILALGDATSIDQLSHNRELKRIAREPMPALGAVMSRFQISSDIEIDDIRQRLRKEFPSLSIDFNHGYEMAAEREVSAQDPGSVGGIFRLPEVRHPKPPKVGMIDSSVNTKHPVFLHSRITQKRFLPSWLDDDTQHGTAVASLLVGRSSELSGIIPQAELFVASVFTSHAEHGAIATTSSLVRALNWLASEQVDVINISLAGPPNVAVERAIALLAGEGFLIIAAVGNEGPLAEPRFPAAYPNVIAVTAVDINGRVYQHAGRGEHVDYAALGVNLQVATNDAGYALVSGTSYATPLVTGLVLYYLALGHEENPLLPEDDIVDLGSPGFDEVYGRGLPGKQFLTKDLW